MGAAPVYVATPRTWFGQISTGNTNRDGTTGSNPVIMAGNTAVGSPGSRVDRIRAQAIATTALGAVRLFLFNGTNARMIREIEVPVQAFSLGVTEPWSQDITFADGFVVPNGWSLLANTNNSETFNIIVYGGDY